MESNQVLDLVGSEVYWERKKLMADIVSYEKGWVKIRTDDGEEHKVRAKEITLMDSDEVLVETEEGLDTQTEDPSEASSEVASVSIDKGSEIDCSCGNTFEAPSSETFQCPACGTWHYVRLHPDLSKYVTGLDATASGRDTVDINDEVANMLRGMDLNSLYDFICDKLNDLYPEAMFSKAMMKDFTESSLSCSEFLQDRYAERNPGMQRMNLGNLLRGAYKRHNIIADREAAAAATNNSEKMEETPDAE